MKKSLYRYSIYNYEYQREEKYVVTNFISKNTLIMDKELFYKYENFIEYLEDNDVKKMIKLGFIEKTKN